MKEDTKKNSKNRQKKEGIVAEISEKVTKAKGMVFTNYQGLTHQQLERFKKALRTLEADFVITKNTLLKRALQGKEISQENLDKFKQATGTLFLYNDPIGPLKELAKLIKEVKMPTIKFGFLDGKSLTENDVLKLSTLPPLPILRSQLVGQLQSPIAGLHRSLNWNLQKFVMTLKAIETNKAAS